MIRPRFRNLKGLTDWAESMDLLDGFDTSGYGTGAWMLETMHRNAHILYGIKRPVPERLLRLVLQTSMVDIYNGSLRPGAGALVVCPTCFRAVLSGTHHVDPSEDWCLDRAWRGLPPPAIASNMLGAMKRYEFKIKVCGYGVDEENALFHALSSLRDDNIISTEVVDGKSFD